MALTTWALRARASACASALDAKALAWPSGADVARWLITAMTNKQAAGGERDEAEARMDEEYRGEVERRHRRIEQDHHGRRWT